MHLDTYPSWIHVFLYSFSFTPARLAFPSDQI